jgi:hypothetical protein
MTNRLSAILQKSGKKNPFTFPAFVKSRKSPINSSGLVIEIADLNPINDNEKFLSFITSKNWDFYLNACRSYGFMVDQNVPWRLIADIGSEEMLKYARNYNLNSVDEILAFCYEPADYRYYLNFSQNLLDTYNLLVPRSIIKKIECNNKIQVKIEKPKKYSNTESLLMKYNKKQIINLYCNFRFSEEERHYTDNQKKLLIKDTISISKIRGESVAIQMFEREINKTFDYQGSLGYYIQKSEVREQEEIFGENNIPQTARY